MYVVSDREKSKYAHDTLVSTVCEVHVKSSGVGDVF